MDLKFIVDTQLPPGLSDIIQHKGYDSIHTTFFPNGHLLKDKEIKNIAIKENRIIISKDNDFFDSYLLKGAPPKVLIIELGNIKNKKIFTLLIKNFSKIVYLFEKENSNLVILKQNKVVSF